MNNAQATMSGARKTGDMGWARGKGVIMPTMWSLRHVRQRLFRMLQQSFLFACAEEETTAASAAMRDMTHDSGVPSRPRNLRAVRVSCDSRTSLAFRTQRRASIENHRDERARERDLVPIHSPSKGGDTP
ncbi:hypothetical protein [Burkholderia catarinensis]|uniref:hypothetical protein n=1 Tax=Burkholderia catarinensis TaxID=1108140 RepID=UPI001C59F17A|nr:hypothetical protein [Burkholderia catarinensis]